MTVHAQKSSARPAAQRARDRGPRAAPSAAAPQLAKAPGQAAISAVATGGGPGALQRLADGSPQVLQAAGWQQAADRHAASRHPTAATSATGGGAALPDGLRAGIEHLSGLPLDAVRVHYNSAAPQRLGAQAFAQGRDIHLSPGHEAHLPHEAWHVVQQAQGRVSATGREQGTAINEDATLEREAQQMGERARSAAPGAAPGTAPATAGALGTASVAPPVAAVAQMYRVTGEWVSGMFGYKNVTECRQAIGEAAFGQFMALDTAELQPLSDFFIRLKPDGVNPSRLDVQRQAALLVPLLNAPVALALMREALTITAYDAGPAPAIQAYLLKHEAKGPKAQAAARQLLTQHGNNPVAADQEMTEIEPYNYHAAIKAKAQTLGHQKAQGEHDVAALQNQQLRSSYITSFTTTTGLDLTQPDDALSQSLGARRADLETQGALSKNAADKQKFIDDFQVKTGYAHDFHGYTAKQFNKPLEHKKLHAGLAELFGPQSFTRDGTPGLASAKIKEFDDRATSLPLQHPKKQSDYTLAAAKKLQGFSTTGQKLATDLTQNKASYTEALRLAIAPLFAFADSEAAADWVLTSAGADAAAAAQQAVWIANGFAAGLKLDRVKYIFGLFPLSELQAIHAPTGVADAKAQAALKLLNVAQPGEAARFKTLIERDETRDYAQLAKLLNDTGPDIDRSLQVLSKPDKSKDVNTLLGKLSGPTVPDHLQRGEDYLKHKGKAVDAVALVDQAISDDHAQQLLKKDWIVGFGTQVAHVYVKSGRNVTQTIAVLDKVTTATKKKTPADVKTWLDVGHTFVNIHTKLQAYQDQQFWAGETCLETDVLVTKRLGETGKNDNVNVVINQARSNKTVGQFYTGGNFGNAGNYEKDSNTVIGMVLPDNENYREYDVKPYASDDTRGMRRVVVGGSRYYYTSDHYASFARFRA